MKGYTLIHERVYANTLKGVSCKGCSISLLGFVLALEPEVVPELLLEDLEFVEFVVLVGRVFVVVGLALQRLLLLGALASWAFLVALPQTLVLLSVACLPVDHLVLRREQPVAHGVWGDYFSAVLAQQIQVLLEHPSLLLFVVVLAGEGTLEVVEGLLEVHLQPDSDGSQHLSDHDQSHD